MPFSFSIVPVHYNSGGNLFLSSYALGAGGGGALSDDLFAEVPRLEIFLGVGRLGSKFGGRTTSQTPYVLLGNRTIIMGGSCVKSTGSVTLFSNFL